MSPFLYDATSCLLTCMTQCSVEICDRDVRAHGLCRSHYDRLRRYGDTRADVPFRDYAGGACTIDGCDRRHEARGLCAGHYTRLRAYGDPLAGKPLAANRARSPKPLGYTYVDAQGYAVIKVGPEYPGNRNSYIYEHRLVMEQSLGRSLLAGENVHHVNGNRSDNRLANLELWVTHQPSGQRPQDLVEWAREILDRYEPMTSSASS